MIIRFSLDDTVIRLPFDRVFSSALAVAFNKNSKEKEITFDMGDFKNSGIIEVTRTSGNMSDDENWARLENIAFNTPVISLKLKEHSVTTFVIK